MWKMNKTTASIHTVQRREVGGGGGGLLTVHVYSDFYGKLIHLSWQGSGLIQEFVKGARVLDPPFSVQNIMIIYVMFNDLTKVQCIVECK